MLRGLIEHTRYQETAMPLGEMFARRCTERCRPGERLERPCCHAAPPLPGASRQH
jgi:hypothetical protein